ARSRRAVGNGGLRREDPGPAGPHSRPRVRPRDAPPPRGKPRGTAPGSPPQEHTVRNRPGPSLPLAVLPLLPLASRPSLAQDSPYGVDIHSPTGAELKLDLDRIQAHGSGWVHVAVIWPYVEGTQGVYDWSAYDEIVAAAEARHLEILATILYTPSWATKDPTWTGV